MNMDVLSLLQNENVKQITIEKKEVLDKSLDRNEHVFDMYLSVRVVYKNDAQTEQPVKLRDYLEHWLYEYKRHELKASSFDRKEQIAKQQIIPRIGEIELKHLTSSDVQNMINKLSAKYSYSTVKKAYECLNGCLKFAVKNHQITMNPADGTVLPKNLQLDTKEVRCFTENEVQKIEQECVRCYQNGNRVFRLGEIIIFLLNTGLRIGEALALEWSDIDFERAKLKVRKNVVCVKKRSKDGRNTGGYQTLKQNSTKTKKGERTVPLNRDALMVLMAVRTINGKSKYVFATKSGKRVNHRNIDRMFRCILRNCEIASSGVHALRHTFASRLFAKGVDVKTVSQLLGHSEVGITYDTYIHIIQEQEIAAVNALTEL